jgi:hypothetical protein
MDIQLFINYDPSRDQVVIERETSPNRYNESILTFKQFSKLYGSSLSLELQDRKHLSVSLTAVVNE